MTPRDGSDQRNKAMSDRKQQYDQFNLRTVFPDPKAVFDYKSPTVEALKDSCMFVLDTNTLMAPFKVGKKSLKDIDRVYRKLGKERRLFAPAQAVREYGRNRQRAIQEVFTHVQDGLSKLPHVKPLESPMLEGHPSYAALETSIIELKGAVKKYESALRSIESALIDWGWNDNVSTLYRDVLASQIVDHDLTDEQVLNDLEWRITHTIPPGYKDQAKPDRGIGDLLIWHSILSLGEKSRQNVVFVSNDEKADWVVQGSSKTIMTSPLLCIEFRRRSNADFAVCSWPRFLEIMGADQQTVQQAKAAKSRSRSRGEAGLIEVLGEISLLLSAYVSDSSGAEQFDDHAYELLRRKFMRRLSKWERDGCVAEHTFLDRIVNVLQRIEPLSFLIAELPDAANSAATQVSIVDDCREFCQLYEAYHEWWRLRRS